MDIFTLSGRIALNGVDETQRELSGVTGQAEQSSDKISSAFKKIGKILAAAFAIDKIIDFGKAIVNASATVAAETSAFEQIMGSYSNAAQEKLKAVANTTGVVDTRLTAAMTSMTAKFKGLGFDVEEATNMATRGLTIASDAAAFWDKSLEDSQSHLNSFINGSYEGGEAIGLFANDTQMAAYAIRKGLVATSAQWAALDEATKQATRLEYAEQMMVMSGATGQAAKESEQYANVQANLTEKWRQFKAQIGEPILQNIVIPVMKTLSGIIDNLSVKFQQLQTWIAANKPLVEALAIVIGTLTAAIIAYNISQHAATIATMLATTATTLWGAAVAFATAPITLIILAIGALVAAFVYLWNNCEGFRNFWTGLWNDIVAAVKPTIDAIIIKWNEFKTRLDESLAQIKIALQPLIEAFNTIKTAVVDAWNNSIAPIFDAFKTKSSETATSVNGDIGATGGVLQGLVDIVSFVFNSIVWIIDNIIKPIITSITTFIQENLSSITLIIEGVMNVIGGIIKIFLSLIQGDWEGVWEGIKQFFSGIWDAIVGIFEVAAGIFKAIWEGIKNFFTGLWSKIKGDAEEGAEGTTMTVSEKWEAFKAGTEKVWNSITGFFSNTWGKIKETAANNAENIKNSVADKWSKIKETTSNVWGNIKDKIKEKIDAAKDTVKNIIDKIKGFFKFEWNLPKLKMPHLKIDGEFSIVPPKVPKFSIDWYKKAMDNAMLLNGPTIFGMNPSGQLMGGGEAGQEVVAGSNTLMSMIRSAVNEESGGNYMPQLITMLENYLSEIVARSDKSIVLDDNTLVGKMTSKIDESMGNLNKLKARGI